MQVEGQTPLHFASQVAAERVVAALLQHPMTVATINQRDCSGTTQLDMVVMSAREHPESGLGVVRRLLAAGANPGLANFEGQVR